MKERQIVLPKPLLGSIVLLLVLGYVAHLLTPRMFTEQQIANNVLLAAIPFILIFVAIVLAFVTLIVVASTYLSHAVPESIYRVVEYAAMAGILAGIVAMFQPWSLALYRLGFLLLFMATLFYILWSHISPMITEEIG
ncbi:hypothetical protein FKZ61_020795 [Litorilinea aerophila]|uniref:Uncharacterized protein n=1 Tax=Litorilinea aerophila TaxID=1204385 RepID=A0A540V9W5_9CHLR|nr:hypothetical protein [Litorilinea aerophila]MCC9078543.1 hypothetical protein [Litorilinea aerophila]OUC04892.1 hypothetical protein RY27_30585 [Litorilinea aerophila]GIV79940.1 MAG: hypothetical protein KatS3mg050_4334 [Litorilinea sp.]